MQRLFTILTGLWLAFSVGAQSARADGVTYMISGTYADGSTTAVSAPGASFTFTFKVPSTVTGNFSSSGSGGFVDLTGINVTFSSPALTGFSGLASLSFAPSSSGGLLDLGPFPSGPDFVWSFTGLVPGGPQLFSLNSCPSPPPPGCSPDTVATFLTGPFAYLGGTGFNSSTGPTGSFFFDMNNIMIGGDLTDGTVTGSAVTTPEPSSMLLLGSGFLALGGFARKRLVTLFS